MNYSVLGLENLSIKRELIYGYSRVQVERIFAKVKEDYLEYTQKIRELQDEAAVMKETLKHYKAIEESLQHTLILAHSTSDSIKLEATDKAADIIQTAEMKAKKIIDDADLKVIKIKSDYEELKFSFNSYKQKTQALLNSLQDYLKTSFEENAD